MSTSTLSYQLFIDGEWADSSGDDALDVVNPATEEVIGTVPQATPADVDRAVDAARKAFDEGPWPRMTPRERGAIMLKMGAAFARRREQIVDLNIREAGSTRMLAEFLQVGIPIEHFIDMADRVLPRFDFEAAMLPYVGQGIGQGVVVSEPYGVAGLISAYNFPFFLNLFKLAPALAAGCTTVLKPSPLTPLEAFVIGEVAQEAGLPPGVLNIVTGDIPAGEALTRHPGVDLISFTGSDAVGRKVYGQGAGTLKKVVLELGGKSANVILDDASLDKVTSDVIGGMTIHCGQGCSLLTRTLVHESLHDELVSRLKAGLDYVKVGDPADPAVMMGPLISEQQRQKVEGLIRAGQAEGRADRPRRRAPGRARQGLLRRADAVRQRGQLDADRAAGVLRTGRGDHPVLDRRGGGQAGQRQRLRPGRRGVVGRPGPRIRHRQAAAHRHDHRQRRGRRPQPLHRVRRLQAERARP